MISRDRFIKEKKKEKKKKKIKKESNKDRMNIGAATSGTRVVSYMERRVQRYFSTGSQYQSMRIISMRV